MNVFCRIQIRRSLVFALVAGFLAQVFSHTARGEPKPVLVVSVSGVNALISEAGFLSRLTGMGDMGPLITMMATPYTQGLDRERPIGIVVNAEEDAFDPLGFVPITDLDQLLKVLPPQAGSVKKLDGGLLQLEGRAPIFIREKNGWAFLGQTPESLANPPLDPLSLLQGLDKEYKLAVRLVAPNIPPAYRQMMMSAIEQGMQARVTGNQNDPEFQLQQEMMRNQFKQLESLIEETEQMTLGWNTDQTKKTIYFDGTLQARPSTKLAQRMGMLNGSKTSFAGLLQGTEAAVMGNLASRLHPDDVEQQVRMFDSLRAAAVKALENSGELPPDRQEKAKQIVVGLVDVAKQTLRAGQLDGVLAIALDSGPIQTLTAGRLAGGRQLESLLKEAKELVKDMPDLPDIQFDVARIGDVGLHTLRVQVPEEQDARRLFGTELELAVGLSEDHAYTAIGPGAIDRLRLAIGTTQAAEPTPIDPFSLTVRLGRIARFVASMRNEPQVQAMEKALRGVTSDAIRVTGTPVANGERIRLEIEEGILRAIAAARMGNAAPAPGGASPNR
jgi:hypothetical protein